MKIHVIFMNFHVPTPGDGTIVTFFPVFLCRDEGDKATLDDQLYYNNSMNESWTKKMMRER